MDDERVQEIDVFRDTPVRYFGYANEVGEAFRSMIGRKWVHFTYALATLYVIADTLDKSIKTYKVKENDPKHKKKVMYTTADTLIWQLLASVAIPGFTINRICAFSDKRLQRSVQLPQRTRNIVVAGIGLFSIPFIIRPIDNFVDLLLDASLRKFQP